MVIVCKAPKLLDDHAANLNIDNTRTRLTNIFETAQILSCSNSTSDERFKKLKIFSLGQDPLE